MAWVRSYIGENDLVGKPLSVSDAIAVFDQAETPFLSRVSPSLRNLSGPGGMVPFGQRSFKFKEKVRRHNHTTLNGAVAAGVTTFILTDAICRAGDMIVVDDEVILLGSTSNNLTFTGCTRSVGTGADQDQASGDDVFVFGTSYAEHQNFPTGGPVFEAAEVTTYTDILMESFDLSGSAQNVEQYAEMSLGDKAVRCAADTFVILKKQLEQRVLFSSAQSPNGETTAGMMLGVYERVAATNYIDLGGASPTYEGLQQAVRKCKRWGGLKSGQAAVFCSDFSSHVIDRWQIPHVQAPAEASSIFGANVSAIRVGDAILEVYPANESGFLENHLLCSTDNVRVGPQCAEREFSLYQSAKVGDYNLWAVLGEYTCEVRGVYSHCYLLNALFSA